MGFIKRLRLFGINPQRNYHRIDIKYASNGVNFLLDLDLIKEILNQEMCPVDCRNMDIFCNSFVVMGEFTESHQLLKPARQGLSLADVTGYLHTTTANVRGFFSMLPAVVSEVERAQPAAALQIEELSDDDNDLEEVHFARAASVGNDQVHDFSDNLVELAELSSAKTISKNLFQVVMDAYEQSGLLEEVQPRMAV